MFASKKAVATFLVGLMMIGTVPSISCAGESTVETGARDLTPHTIIRVNSDAELGTLIQSEGWEGSGTLASPYLIRDLDINGSGTGPCIFIGNTTSHVTISNCTLQGARYTGGEPMGPGAGIILYNVKNAIVQASTCIGNNYGIYADGSSSNRITRTNCSGNNLGILFMTCGGNELDHNLLEANDAIGIQFANSGAAFGQGPNWVHNNTFRTNGLIAQSVNSGLFLWGAYSKNNILENNLLDGNWKGIGFRASGITGNTVRGNTISNSTAGAIEYTNGAGPNTFYHNSFINNTAQQVISAVASDVYSLPWPEGGNHWSTFSGVDVKWGPAQDKAGADGMGDSPYTAFGITDKFPWMAPAGWQKVQNLNTSAWYTTIQTAVYEAAPGDSLSISNGTYHEDVKISDRALNLLGASRDGVVVSGSAGATIDIRYDGNHLANLTAQNTASGSGIYIDADGCVLDNVACSGNYRGLMLDNASGTKVSGGLFTGNSYTGIGLYSGSDQNEFRDVQSTLNGIFGLDIFTESSANLFQNCTFSGTQNTGVLVNGRSYYNRFQNCTVQNNKDYGMVIGNGAEDDCAYTQIKGGTVSGHAQFGILLMGAVHNVLSGMKISDNGKAGLVLEAGSENNSVYLNEFVSNNGTGVQAREVEGGNTWSLPYPGGGNFWSDYAGTDLRSGELQDMDGSDGFGDTPQVLDGKGKDNYPLMGRLDFSPSLSLVEVRVSPQTAIIGITDVTISATIYHKAGRTLRLNVSFLLDGQILLGTNLSDIPNDAPDKVSELTTNFSEAGMTAGVHNITAVFFFGASQISGVSGDLTLESPFSDVRLKSILLDTGSVVIRKGGQAGVNATATLRNWGNLAATDVLVRFYLDGSLTPTAEVPAGAPLEPGADQNVSWAWAIDDSVAPGYHTIAAGVGPESEGYRQEANLTVQGLPDTTITNLTSSALSEFEGTEMTFTVTLFNNGTADDIVTVRLLGLGALTATLSNQSVPKGMTREVSHTWILPDVDADRVWPVTASVGESVFALNITVKNRAEKLEITSFTVPDGLKVGMTVLFRAVVRNNGTANASAVQVMFFDNTAGVLVNLNRSSAFNLMPGSTFEASAMCTLIGPANSTHIFLARVTGAEANQTKLIGNALVPATVRIKSFTAAPSKMTDRPRDSAQTFRLTLVLENTGELAGTVFVTVIQGTKVIVPLDEKKVEPGTNLTVTYDWRVKGEGKHTAAVSITGGVEPSSGSVNVQLGYKSTSGPDYMILIVLVVVMAAVAGAGAAFAMKKRGKPMKQGPAGESEGTQGKDGKT